VGAEQEKAKAVEAQTEKSQTSVNSIAAESGPDADRLVVEYPILEILAQYLSPQRIACYSDELKIGVLAVLREAIGSLETDSEYPDDERVTEELKFLLNNMFRRDHIAKYSPNAKKHMGLALQWAIRKLKEPQPIEAT
jgi:hypothetical protein